MPALLAIFAVLGLVGALLCPVLEVFAAIALTAVGSIILGVLANDLDRNAAVIGVRLVSVAASLLPRCERPDAIAEWSDYVLSASEDRRGVRPLLAALTICLIAAPVMAIVMRFDPRRSRSR